MIFSQIKALYYNIVFRTDLITHQRKINWRVFYERVHLFILKVLNESFPQIVNACWIVLKVRVHKTFA